MKKMYIYVLIILGLISCISKTKYDKAIITIDSLKVENQKLLVENEELLHGEERLINYINNIFFAIRTIYFIMLFR